MIVSVTSESDVQKTVPTPSPPIPSHHNADRTPQILYANSHNKPFLAISGGHGTTSQINNIKNGIGIHLRALTQISIVDNGSAALIQGGVSTGALIPFLWSRGKQTVSTGCDCVGYLAPILGGGHGWLQGRYGLASDQLTSARMVLANGTAVTVSAESNPDLFWAIRGAGHNFGIVTEAKLRIYDRETAQDEWAASGFVYTRDKMEKVFALANGWLERPERPAGMVHYGLFALNPEVDAVNVSTFLLCLWKGDGRKIADSGSRSS